LLLGVGRGVSGEGGRFCLERLEVLPDGRLAPMTYYAELCAKNVLGMLRITRYLGDLYVYDGGVWIGEPQSVDVIKSIVWASYVKLELMNLGWRYTSFEKKVLAGIRAGAPVAEPIRGVRAGSHIILWEGSRYEIRDYNGGFVTHDIPSRVRSDVLAKARSMGWNARQLAESEAPRVVEVFKEWAGDVWLALFEVIGYTTIAYDYPLHKAIMLVGEGSSGKSSYLRLVTEILGPWNVSSIPLQAFTSLDYRFLWGSIINKPGNIFPDLPQKPLRDTGIFKALTGEDYIFIDRKGKEPVRYRNYAKMIFAANQLPQVSDLTHAFYRRWLIIRFTGRFQEDPTWYSRVVTMEFRDRALTVGLEAMREVLERRAFTGRSSEVKEFWLRETDQVYNFIRTLEEPRLAKRDPNGRVEARWFYELYTRWAEREGLEVLAKKNFTEQLAEHGVQKVKSGKLELYKGIMLLERPDVVEEKLLKGEQEDLEAYI